MSLSNETLCAEYQLVTAEKSLNGQNYVCYGIRLICAGTEVTVEDLSLDREEVEELVALCNRLELSPVHFRDVIEDFLAGK